MHPPFWISDIDKNGRVIDQRIIQTAKILWPQAVTATERHLGDPTRTSEILETAVHRVWEVVLKDGIYASGKVEHYLRRTFHRLVKSIAQREQAIEYKSPDELNEELETSPKYICYDDPSRPLQLEEFLQCLTEKEQTLVILRALKGYNWKYISNQTGIPVKSARVQYCKAMRKLERTAETLKRLQKEQNEQANKNVSRKI